jgi:hypothetical protein
MQIAGFNRGYDRATVSHGTAERSMTVSYFQGERLIAVDCLNDARSFMLANASLAFETALKVQSLPQWRSVGPQRRWLTSAAVWPTH